MRSFPIQIQPTNAKTTLFAAENRGNQLKHVWSTYFTLVTVIWWLGDMFDEAWVEDNTNWSYGDSKTWSILVDSTIHWLSAVLQSTSPLIHDSQCNMRCGVTRTCVLNKRCKTSCYNACTNVRCWVEQILARFKLAMIANRCFLWVDIHFYHSTGGFKSGKDNETWELLQHLCSRIPSFETSKSLKVYLLQSEICFLLSGKILSLPLG